MRKISQIIEEADQKGNGCIYGGLKQPTFMGNTKYTLNKETTEESEVIDTDRDQIAGQRISVIKSILQKMLIMQDGRPSKAEANIIWSQHEMRALTDIFKNIVSSEMESKKHQNETSQKKKPINAEIFQEHQRSQQKISVLEQKNLQMAREIEELKSQLLRSQKQKKNSPSQNLTSEFTDQPCENSSVEQSSSQSRHPSTLLQSRNMSLASSSHRNSENMNTQLIP